MVCLKVITTKEDISLSEIILNIITLPKKVSILKYYYENSYLNQEKKNLFKNELEQLKAISKKITDFPESAQELNELRNISSDYLDLYHSISEECGNALIEIAVSALNTAKNKTKTGAQNTRKTLLGFKSKGDIGKTFTDFQLAGYFGSRISYLLIDLDAATFSEFESIKKRGERVMGALERNLSPNLIENPNNKIHNFATLSTNIELEKYLIHGNPETLPYLDLMKYKPGDKLDEFTALLILTKLYIGAAEELSGYKFISFDCGQINDFIYGFYAYYIDNHCVFANIDDNELYKSVNDIKDGIIETGILTHYKNLRYKFSLQNDHPRRLFLVLNTQHRAHNTKAQEYQTKKQELINVFSERTKTDKANIFPIILNHWPHAFPSTNKQSALQKPNLFLDKYLVEDNATRAYRQSILEYIKIIEETILTEPDNAK